MESQSSQTNLTSHILQKMIEACEMLMTWNENVSSTDFYTTSPTGIEKMAASCMLIESIGEGVKKIDKLMPGLLSTISPEIRWKQVMGLRDHIAHGYFNLDADIIYNVVKNEIPALKASLIRIIRLL